MELSSQRDLNLLVETFRRLNYSAKETYKAITVAWGASCIKLRRVQGIYSEFSKGERANLERKEGSGRKSDENKVEIIEMVKQHFEQGNQSTTRELAEKFNTSKDMIWRILVNDLEFKCMSNRWVPYVLKDCHKNQRVQCCQNLMKVLESRNGYRRLVMTDEKWFYDRPQGNEQTRKSWVPPDGDRATIARRSASSSKRLIMMAMGFNGLSFFKILAKGDTVNGDVYKDFLVEAFRSFDSYDLRRKGLALTLDNVLLQHDNATPHKCGTVKAFLESKMCTLVIQSPYSPDLNILDRAIFPILEMRRSKIAFDDDNSLSSFLTAQVDTFTSEIMSHEKDKLIAHCQSVLDARGDYV